MSSALFAIIKRTRNIPEGYTVNRVFTDFECMEYMAKEAMKGNKITILNKMAIEPGKEEEWKVVVSLMGKDS